MSQSAEYRIRSLLEGTGVEINGPNSWDPQIHDPSIYPDFVKRGTLAFGETYMAGKWDCEQLDVMTATLIESGSPVVKHFGLWNVATGLARAFITDKQNKRLAKRNVADHYDEGNELFGPMLGRTMAYSCAYWEREDQPTAKGATTLDLAQDAKFDLVCKKAGLRPGMRMLDIGCGWGGLLNFAVEQYGVEGVGITLSEEQFKYVNDRDLPSVKVRLQDWRELGGETFDAVTSIGQFEHVGHRHHKEYFGKVREALAPDGLYVHHTISSAKRRYISDPFISTYVFPGGEIPSNGQIKDASRDYFTIADWQELAPNYDPTLMAWAENLDPHWPKLLEFRNPNGTYKYRQEDMRRWQYYPRICAGAFRTGLNLLSQVVMGSEEAVEGYERVR